MIFLDTNVVSEPMRKVQDPGVVDWLERHDAELALSTIVIGEIAFGIEKIDAEQRARRLTSDFDALHRRYADRIFAFTEAAALNYGMLMAERKRAGRPMPIADAMIAAIARTHGAGLATRNLADFDGSGLELISPAPHRTALAPAAQPRPAPPGRALPSAPFTKGGSILDAD